MNVAYMMQYLDEQEEAEALQAEADAYYRTPEGEFELALTELENAAQRVLKISDFTPEMFQKNYLVEGNNTVTFREAFIEIWRMVNWTKENLSNADS